MVRVAIAGEEVRCNSNSEKVIPSALSLGTHRSNARPFSVVVLRPRGLKLDSKLVCVFTACSNRI